MFKSTKEFDNAIYKVLTTIRDSGNLESITEYGDNDLGDVIELCLSRRYLTGVNVQTNAFGDLFINGNPRITYNGLSYLENSNK